MPFLPWKKDRVWDNGGIRIRLGQWERRTDCGCTASYGHSCFCMFFGCQPKKSQNATFLRSSKATPPKHMTSLLALALGLPCLVADTVNLKWVHGPNACRKDKYAIQSFHSGQIQLLDGPITGIRQPPILNYLRDPNKWMEVNIYIRLL